MTDKELREEFDNWLHELNYAPSFSDIATWWLSKLHQREAELVKEMEEKFWLGYKAGVDRQMPKEFLEEDELEALKSLITNKKQQ